MELAKKHKNMLQYLQKFFYECLRGSNFDIPVLAAVNRATAPYPPTDSNRDSKGPDEKIVDVRAYFSNRFSMLEYTRKIHQNVRLGKQGAR